MATQQQFEHREQPTTRRSFWMFWILILGFALRTYLLDLKPVHFDEGINGNFVRGMWRDGFYHYDPTNFHGPLYFYILMVTEKSLGWGIANFRFATGLISVATLWVVGLHRRFVGSAAIFAALIMAVSPAFVFYSRYAIHESLFIFGQVAFSYGYFMYRDEKSTRSIWWMAFAIITLVTTKETFFIYLGTWAIAVASVHFFEALFPSYQTPASHNSASRTSGQTLEGPGAQTWIAISMVAAVIIVALFTGFFIYMHGAQDMLLALMAWTHTGTAHTGHEKPAMYWLELLQLYEWPCLIGLAATPFVFFAKSASRALRILALAGLGTWMAYTLIPYKTPWLILNFLWMLAFTSGAIIARVISPVKQWRGLRTGAAVATFATIIVSVVTMLRLNFKNFANPQERYVYVQSTIQFRDTMNAIYTRAKQHPEDINMHIFGMTRDPWPMPYTLENMTNVTWGHDTTINLHDADVVLSDAEDKVSIEARLHGRFLLMPFQIRDAYAAGQAYFREEKFKDLFPAGQTVIEGMAP